MTQHKDQRVGVFVDVQNMYYSAKQFYHTKVNFAHILNRAVAGRRLVRAIAYVIKADIKDEVNFFEALEKIGYDVRSKDLQTFYGGAKKGDWDVGIAMDIMRMASKLDVVVLVSGDGDFKDLLEHVKSLGCRAEVVAFRKTASSRILSEADDFIDLDKELDKVLIKDVRYIPKKRPESFPIKKEFHEYKPQAPSLLERINMEQPVLVRPKKEDIVMPAAEKKEELPGHALVPEKQIEKKEEPKEQKKKIIVKNVKHDRQESMLRKVISKVTKKK
jgi:uncharacterized LabA/DUF88 family protein